MVQYEERQDYHERAEDYRESERDKGAQDQQHLSRER